jgi:hypothetical protein
VVGAAVVAGARVVVVIRAVVVVVGASRIVDSSFGSAKEKSAGFV